MRYLIFIILILTCSCDSHEGENASTKIVSIESAAKLIPHTVLETKSTIQQASLLEKDLFGKFFNDRAEFYIVEKPANLLFDRPIDKIVFYFLDDELCQTRYFIHDDISTELINSYGKFTITGLDYETRNFFKNNPALVSDGFGFHLNKQIRKYELRWQLPDKEILFRVSQLKSEWIYTERKPKYKSIFNEVQLN
jgi:hypothetical protein